MTILASWDGEHFVPFGRYAKQCDRDYVVGETYTLDVILERSTASHRQFFAAVHDGWLNLPEAVAERFPSSKHLRKYCLIKAGFRDERSIACSSKAEAQRIAAFIAPIDDYALVTVKDAVVVVYTAKSQSYRAMGKDDFQKSKAAVLEIISDMIGVTQRQLEKASA